MAATILNTFDTPYDIVITSPSENEVVWTTTPTIIWTAFADSYVEIEDGFYNLIGSWYADENGDFSVILTTSLEEWNNTILVYPSLDLEDWESFLPSDYPYIEWEEDEVERGK